MVVECVCVGWCLLGRGGGLVGEVSRKGATRLRRAIVHYTRMWLAGRSCVSRVSVIVWLMRRDEAEMSGSEQQLVVFTSTAK